jgi:hypothetical protein
MQLDDIARRLETKSNPPVGPAQASRSVLLNSTAVAVAEILMAPVQIVAEACAFTVLSLVLGGANMVRALVKPLLHTLGALVLVGFGAAGGYSYSKMEPLLQPAQVASASGALPQLQMAQQPAPETPPQPAAPTLPAGDPFGLKTTR